MGKVKPVKWAIGAEEPEDLDEFLSNDEIVAKHTNKKTQEIDWPRKGPWTFKVVQLRVKPNKNGDDRIGVMLTLKEPKDSDAASWNGYMIWDGFNVTEQGAPFLKRFLRALGLQWSDFVKKSKQDDQDPPHLVQIGGVKFEDAKDVTLRATIKVMDADDYNDDEHMEVGRYLPLDDSDEADEVEDEEDEEEEVEEFAEADEEEEEEVEDESDDELREELDSLKKKDLKERALENDEDADVEGLDKQGLIDLIVEQESAEDEDEEDEEDEEAELREELSGMKVPALEKRAQRTAKKFKGDPSTIPTKKADLVDWIVNAELGEPPF